MNSDLSSSQQKAPANSFLNPRGYWERLTLPHPSIQESERRRRARLLSSLLLILIVSGIIAVLLTLLLVDSLSSILIGSIGLIVTVTAYVISRTKHYMIAAALTITNLLASVLTGAIINHDPEYLYFLILGVLLSSLYLSPQATILVFATTVSTILLIPAVSSAIHFSIIIVNGAFLVGLTGILATIAASIQFQDFKHIEQQAFELAANLAELERGREVLHQSETRLANILDNAAEAIVSVDENQNIILFNHGAEEIFGYQAGEILGQPLDWLIPSGYAEAHRQNVDAFGAHLPTSRHMYQRQEVSGRCKDGSEFPAQVGISTHGENGKVIYTAILVDITERKLAEEARRRRAEELEALAQVSSALRQAHNLAEMEVIILEATLKAMGAQAGTFFLLDEDSQELFVVATSGYPVDASHLRLKMGQGLAGQCAQSDLPILTDDIATDHRIRMPEAFRDLHKALCVPLKSSEEILGVLLVCFTETGLPSPNEVNLLTTISENMGNALHRARLFDETQERAAQLALLYDAGLALNSVLEPHAQMEFLFKIAMDVLHADRAAFFRHNGAQDELQLDLGLGYKETDLTTLKGLRFLAEDEQGPVGWVAKNRTPINLPEILQESRPFVVDTDVKSGMWVPVVRANQLIGVLSVLSTSSKAFTPHHEQLIILFANQAAVAMENARLFAETGRRLQHLQALRAIDIAISSSLDLRVIFDVLLDKVTAQLNLDVACVLLLNPHTQILEFAAGRGFRTQALQHTHLRLGEGYAGLAALEKRIIHKADLRNRKTDFLRSPLFSSEGFVAYYAVPLIAKGHVKGVMEVFQRAPLDPDQDWLDFLDALAGQAAIALDNAGLFDDLQRSNVELMLAYDTTIEGWSRGLDLRDRETEGHSQRVTEMTLKLAREMGLSDAELVHVRRGALLHDIGKMGVPDYILHKPGGLTDEEWEIMRKHPVYAYEMLSPIAYLRPALDIPYCHHEKWDGKGYRRGLKGEQIPLAARIFALADVWDALRSDRPYREAWSIEKVLEYIQGQAGKHFDPKVVETFLRTTEDKVKERV